MASGSWILTEPVTVVHIRPRWSSVFFLMWGMRKIWGITVISASDSFISLSHTEKTQDFSVRNIPPHDDIIHLNEVYTVKSVSPCINSKSVYTWGSAEILSRCSRINCVCVSCQQNWCCTPTESRDSQQNNGVWFRSCWLHLVQIQPGKEHPHIFLISSSCEEEHWWPS